MDIGHQCHYDGFAQSMQLMFLLSTYCVIFLYCIFLLTVRECMRRFYTAMELNPACLSERFNIEGYEVSLFNKRSYEDWCDAMAYTLWFLRYGSVGLRADQTYRDNERAARRFKELSGALKSYKFEEVKVTYDEAAHVEHAEESKEGFGLLKPNLANSASRFSNSVTPRSDGGGKFWFKYNCCSICLADFKKGEQVKVVPRCGHTFHNSCLEKWLVQKWRCPNCNVKIKAEAEISKQQNSIL